MTFSTSSAATDTSRAGPSVAADVLAASPSPTRACSATGDAAGFEHHGFLTGLAVSTTSGGASVVAFSPLDVVLSLNSKRAGACNASSSTRAL